MSNNQRVKKEGYVTCLSCGQTSLTFILHKHNDAPELTAPCPKCSNTAYTNSVFGAVRFMRAAAREIAQLKLDMIDLQDSGEDR